jgi:hypothetical protein
MALTLQSSVAEITAGTNHAPALQPIGIATPPVAISPLAEWSTEILTSSGLTFPPLTPLHRTCLLLI